MQRSEVFLNAGDFYFHRPGRAARPPVVLRTLLGSCVSVILWHPEKKLGGMCHAVLPTRSQSYGELDGNHCPGAIQLFRLELQRTATLAGEYEAYLLGGARMSLGLRDTQKVSVGERNIETCRSLLRDAGFAIRAEHVGLSGPRRVEFDLASGAIEVLHGNRRLCLGVD
ncbi:MAG TPA: chemotaxis protein CheD [Rhodocyclaceae bacterium]|nr:chemotaxis protein CheD [Rhodocyclaceae bacterium]